MFTLRLISLSYISAKPYFKYKNKKTEHKINYTLSFQNKKKETITTSKVITIPRDYAVNLCLYGLDAYQWVAVEL